MLLYFNNGKTCKRERFGKIALREQISNKRKRPEK